MKGEGNRNKAKCLVYIAAFVLVQMAIIVAFSLTVMRIKSLKVQFGAVSVKSMSTINTTTVPSFNMRLMTQFTVKSTNFGHFKYGNSTVTLLYGGTPVGTAVIPMGRAKARQTRKVNIAIDISSDQLSSDTNLGNDINSGVLILTSEARLSGKVHLMKIIKKKKSGRNELHHSN
ncbi:hypothetical protein Acr_23g0019250 [Actinidia rufa]|uniref:Late embryogenesis abundant (LEA) hydroxyproline-rich glycoprotein family n=1 Tax=Actinidia rufa TaxID=165716 RepID=A0A7J0GRV1_9ERIC|nr:hypothetical protein Acr_23g0019250 [Actinidia rufa]